MNSANKVKKMYKAQTVWEQEAAVVAPELTEEEEEEEEEKELAYLWGRR